MSSWHIGLSVVATDVGGGFFYWSWRLGFTMGLSGSWMLFTDFRCLVEFVPKVVIWTQVNSFTFPQILVTFTILVWLYWLELFHIGYVGFKLASFG
jgi:SSS family solute:Na+ symporter